MLHQLTTTVINWVAQYGVITLFVLLALGIVGLPVPDETLLAFAGILIARGKFMPLPAFLAAFCGSAFGITLSYLIGRTAGNYLVHKYGHWFGITPHKLRQAHNWFERIGKWSLLVGYFIPGVRHLTGYIAGTTRISYGHFAAFAYTGAMLWCATFLTLGYFFGDNLEIILNTVEEYLWIGLLAIVVLAVIYFLWRRRCNKQKQ